MACVAHCATAVSSMALIFGSSLTTSSTLAPIQALALPSRHVWKAPCFSQRMPAACAETVAAEAAQTTTPTTTPIAGVTAQPCSLLVMHSPNSDGEASDRAHSAGRY